MASAHYIGGELHGVVVGFGPEGLSIPQDYRIKAVTCDIPQFIGADADMIFLLHNSLNVVDIEAQQEAMKLHWSEFLASEQA